MRPHILLVFALAACGSEPTASDSEPITYYRDVKPILDGHCVSCHQPGQIGEGTLTSYDEVAARGPLVSGAVSSGVMPPWQPGEGCSDYLGDFSLDEAQVTTLVDWVAAGMPAGDPADDPHVAVPGGSGLSRVDATLAMSDAYTPDSTLDDDYRCFLLDGSFDADGFITGLGVRPGNASAAHHALVFYVAPAQIGRFEERDAADPGLGYRCFGSAASASEDGAQGFGGGATLIGGWAPGSPTHDLPEGTGIAVAEGARLVVQMHYNLASWDGATDVSAVDVKLDANVAETAVTQFFANPAWPIARTMDIPAGDADVAHTFAADMTPLVSQGRPITIYGVGLHMHTRGTTARLSVLPAAGGERCLLDIPRWDFHWQGSYGLIAPVVLQPGDELSIECHWDNSAENQPWVDGMQFPPKDVNWGEGTDDEMCLGTVYATF
jgi:mono/diheme cytochrome c family protein